MHTDVFNYVTVQNVYRRRRQRKAEEAVAYVLHAARS